MKVDIEANNYNTSNCNIERPPVAATNVSILDMDILTILMTLVFMLSQSLIIFMALIFLIGHYLRSVMLVLSAIVEHVFYIPVSVEQDTSNADSCAITQPLLISANECTVDIDHITALVDHVSTLVGNLASSFLSVAL